MAANKSDLIMPVQEISVFRLIEYRGTPQWIAATLQSPGALIPGGTGNWAGRIYSTVIPNELLTLAQQAEPSHRSSSPSYIIDDLLEEKRRLQQRVAELEAGLTQIADAVATPPGMEDQT